MKHLAWVVFAILMAPSVSADYTHLMGDAGRTATVDAGPDHPDTAWRVSINGTRSAVQPPLIHEGEVFVASLRMTGNDPRADVWRLDLETGQGTIWIPDVPAQNFFGEFFGLIMVIGDGQLVVNTGDGLAGYALDGDGSPTWTWAAADAAAPHVGPDANPLCLSLAIEGTRLVAACTLAAPGAGDDTPRSRESGGSTYQAFVVSFLIDACSGPCPHDWIWHRDAATMLSPDVGLERISAASVTPSPGLVLATATTVAAGYVVVNYIEHQLVFEGVEASRETPRVNYGYFSTWVLDAEAGVPVWDDRGPTWASVPRDEGDLILPEHGGDFGYAHTPRINGDVLLFTLDRQLRGTGLGVWEGWTHEIGASTDPVGFSINSITTRDQDLWVGSMDKIYRLDLADGLEEPKTLAQGEAAPRGAPEFWTPLTPFLLAGDTLYASSVPSVEARSVFFEGSDHVTIHAFDAETLGTKWRLRIEDPSPSRLVTPAADFAVSDGMMVLHTRGGDVIGIGGPKRDLDAGGPERYPARGQEIAVRVHEPADAYLFDWGDGSALEWTGASSATHAYARDGVYEVWAIAEQDGMWRSAHWTVAVGGSPPRELNFLQKAFLPENYDLTFGVLGIMLAISGGAIAVTNRRLRHGRLQGEGREERQHAYRRVLAREIEHGDAPEQIAERLKPLRGILGIADRDHARLEAEARALRVAAAGGARLLVPGERFLERYEVERQIGAGGAGLTYLCRDVRLDRRVVLKVLRTAGDDATAAALEEARAYAAVDHDRVVTLIDVEQLGDDVYLVLEYVDGPSLAEQLADGPLEPEAMHRLGEDLLLALEAVHGAGLVHRDVKPANVLVTQGGVSKLGDFGLASAALDDETAVGFDGGAGTARYMAPEQARGERVDARSDLFGAALTLYEAWTGTPYYARRAKESLMDVQMRAAHGKGSLEGVPKDSTLRAFFDRALSTDPASRFQDAAAMRAALLEALEDAEGVRRKKGTRHTRTGKDA